MSTTNVIDSKDQNQVSDEQLLMAILYVKSLFPNDKELQEISDDALIEEIKKTDNSPVISLGDIKLDKLTFNTTLKNTPRTDAIAKLIFDVLRIVVRIAGYSIPKGGEIEKAFVAKISSRIDFSSKIWTEIADRIIHAKSPLDVAKVVLSVCKVIYQLDLIKTFAEIVYEKLGKWELAKLVVKVSTNIAKFIATEGVAFLQQIASMTDEIDILMEDAKAIVDTI